MSLDLAIAVAILIGPGEPPAECQCLPLPLSMSLSLSLPLPLSLQLAGLHLELIDPRERPYLFMRHEDFEADLRTVRRRAMDLRDAPPLHDAMMLPDRELVSAMLTFNRTYREHLAAQLDLERVYWWPIREAIGETDHLYLVWDAARDARCEYYHVHVRRQSLAKLREMIGPAAYAAGTLPPHVPVWRFQRMR